MFIPTRSFLFVLLLAFALVPGQKKSGKTVQAPDPCKDAETQVQMNLCTAEKFKEADAILNTMYKKLTVMLEKELDDARREKNNDMIQYNEKAVNSLKEAERAWIHYRDLHCEAARQQFEGGTIAPSIWNSCMEQVTRHRIEELQQAYDTGDRNID